ncbi:hypothetical protein GDO78_003758 [Eleutherodactylus coqui]|uniref:Uncharacterized protein n=1 Tax=Eleutherodactylus coqui TaxID=57060 RepID=A0A8J6EVH9_ELECQ|nr:hypothetical protein GDO78_003758 [Eleutherodactylus coqui]
MVKLVIFPISDARVVVISCVVIHFAIHEREGNTVFGGDIHIGLPTFFISSCALVAPYMWERPERRSTPIFFVTRARCGARKWIYQCQATLNQLVTQLAN